MPGGPLPMRPMAGSGATPIVPKNGRFSGITTPGATSVVFAARSIPLAWRPVLTGVAAICLTQASLGALAHFIDGERRWVKALVSASFVIYLFHEPLIVLATPWMDLLPIPIWPRFMLLCVAAFLGSYGIWKLIRLSPALRYLFNGERAKRRV